MRVRREDLALVVPAFRPVPQGRARAAEPIWNQARFSRFGFGRMAAPIAEPRLTVTSRSNPCRDACVISLSLSYRRTPESSVSTGLSRVRCYESGRSYPSLTSTLRDRSTKRSCASWMASRRSKAISWSCTDSARLLTRSHQAEPTRSSIEDTAPGSCRAKTPA